MRKFTAEEEAYFLAKAKEAEKCDKLYGVLTEEEFDAWLEEYEKEYEERRKEKLVRKNMH